MSISKTGDHFQSLFEYAPISLWDEDFSGIKFFFNSLRASGVTDLNEYLDEHPEEIENNMHRMKVNHVNCETLHMFGASSRDELFGNLGKIFRDEMCVHFRSELMALWNGDMNWFGDGINYRLSGEALHVHLHLHILPECISNWESVLVSIENISALKQAEKRFHDLFEYAPVSFWEEDYSALKTEFDDLRAQGITDLRAYLASQPEAVDRFRSMIRVLNVNQRTLKLFEADDKEMLLANLKRIFRIEMREYFANVLVDLWNGKTYCECEGINYSFNGEPVHMHLHWTLMPGHEKDFSWVLVALEDISESKKVEGYLRYLSAHDVMTGLYNRTFLEETLQKLEAQRKDPISFIVVDLNELKIANDSFGHHTGDRLIRRAAQALKASIDEAHMAARLGGDEFIIIMPGADEQAANLAMERVQSLVSVNNEYYGEPALSFSLGAATSAPGLSLEKVISLADDAMYRNKGRYYHRRKEDKTSEYKESGVKR